MSTNPTARAWVDVDGSALQRNARRVQASVGPAVRLIPMVKANGYGLGVAGVVRRLDALEPWAFGVATADEGAELRALGVVRRILVLSPVPPTAVAAAVGAGLEVGISSVSALRSLEEAARRAEAEAAFHVEVDTGIGRAGFDWRTVAEWGPIVTGAGADVRWAGCYTHLYSADEDPATIEEQVERFRTALEALDPPAGVAVHVLNSAGAMRAPSFGEAAVRPGIYLYGGKIAADVSAPEPVASVRARVVHLRQAQPGDRVGYGQTHEATAPATWATLAIGYGDGLPRSLGNRGSALLDGRRVPIVGRISMDVTVVDVTGMEGVQLGDVATLIGSDGDEQITVDDVAQLAGTISYEILTGLSARLPRVWGRADGS